jgi:hypothetical protein
VDIWDGLRIVLRRWKVALPIFLVFAVFAFVGSGMIDAEYSANGSVMLIGPSTSGAAAADPAAGEGDGNPLVTGCNSCETVARATQLSLSSTEAKQGMAEAGLSTDYAIVVENRSPLMTLTAKSDTPQGAVDSLAGVIERINGELELQQSDVNAPSDLRITTNVLFQDTAAKGDYGGRTKARAGILAAGILAAAGAALLLEGVKFTRKRRNDDDDYDDDDDDDYGRRDGGAHVARHGPRASAPPAGNGFTAPAAPNGFTDDPSRPRV